MQKNKKKTKSSFETLLATDQSLIGSPGFQPSNSTDNVIKDHLEKLNSMIEVLENDKTKRRKILNSKALESNERVIRIIESPKSAVDTRKPVFKFEKTREEGPNIVESSELTIGILETSNSKQVTPNPNYVPELDKNGNPKVAISHTEVEFVENSDDDIIESTSKNNGHTSSIAESGQTPHSRKRQTDEDKQPLDSALRPVSNLPENYQKSPSRKTQNDRDKQPLNTELKPVSSNTRQRSESSEPFVNIMFERQEFSPNPKIHLKQTDSQINNERLKTERHLAEQLKKLQPKIGNRTEEPLNGNKVSPKNFVTKDSSNKPIEGKADIEYNKNSNSSQSTPENVTSDWETSRSSKNPKGVDSSKNHKPDFNNDIGNRKLQINSDKSQSHTNKLRENWEISKNPNDSRGFKGNGSLKNNKPDFNIDIGKSNNPLNSKFKNKNIPSQSHPENVQNNWEMTKNWENPRGVDSSRNHKQYYTNDNGNNNNSMNIKNLKQNIPSRTQPENVPRNIDKPRVLQDFDLRVRDKSKSRKGPSGHTKSDLKQNICIHIHVDGPEWELAKKHEPRPNDKVLNLRPEELVYLQQWKAKQPRNVYSDPGFSNGFRNKK